MAEIIKKLIAKLDSDPSESEIIDMISNLLKAILELVFNVASGEETTASAE